ncbi:MAG: 3-deoxy-7-phosphoheptulonate synthase [Candidatus Zixiibacteriota bacterium]|nr:MAG: 3-deoxy-7-phosphoheptulonate synthase [candidate division Zixibacteria bacterium]
MIVIMKTDSTIKETSNVIRKIESLGFQPHLSKGEKKTIIGLVGNGKKVDPETFLVMPGVENVVPILHPFKLAGREFKAESSVISVNGTSIGAREVVVMAGPCSVENRDQIHQAAEAVAKAGARILRGGAFKPRTSPYSFQGLGEQGLKFLRQAADASGLAVVTEVMSPQLVELVGEYSDILQIGARNMQNYTLLEAVGKTSKPVLLKRGLMSTIEELLMSAEYILSNGNPNVILCERGIRSFEKYTRNTLDIAAVPIVKKLSHLPIIVDPSHATGKRDLINAMSRCAIAAGADGLIIEVHPKPEEALSDGAQSLLPGDFEMLMVDIGKVAEAVGRRIC